LAWKKGRHSSLLGVKARSGRLEGATSIGRWPTISVGTREVGGEERAQGGDERKGGKLQHLPKDRGITFVSCWRKLASLRKRTIYRLKESPKNKKYRHQGSESGDLQKRAGKRNVSWEGGVTLRKNDIDIFVREWIDIPITDDSVQNKRGN